MAERDIPCPPPDPAPHAPGFVMPSGAVDTHAHLFGPADRYPYSPARGYTPPDATLAQYERLHRILGVARGVLTQPSVYGTDNRLILDTLREQRYRLRAIAVVDPQVSDAELGRMDALGVRGIRINLADPGERPFDSVGSIARMAERLKPLGWHIEFLVHVHEFPELAALGKLAVEISVGHLGYMPASCGLDHPGFSEFLALVRDGRCWVKLSGAYRVTALKATPYTDVAPFARALVAARPDRMLWGTDWPHPICRMPMPNDGDLLDQLAEWVPDATMRRRILVDNPVALYRF